MIADCTAVILAGGQSSRMGQDKANMLFGEETLLQSVTTTLQPLFAEVVISVRERRPEIVQRQICDHPEHQGPLGGLLAGLESATTPWIFLVACDMPFITPAVVKHLAGLRQRYQVVVPRVQGYAQPMAAFYQKDCIDQIRKLLQNPSAKHSLRGALEQLNTCYVEEAELRSADLQLRSFFDLDTPQDVVKAIELQSACDSPLTVKYGQ